MVVPRQLIMIDGAGLPRRGLTLRMWILRGDVFGARLDECFFLSLDLLYLLQLPLLFIVEPLQMFEVAAVAEVVILLRGTPAVLMMVGNSIL
jgi:hypothetical protein